MTKRKVEQLKYHVRCEGNCIKPALDIIERYYKTKAKCLLFIVYCSKRRHGYKCRAEIWKREAI